ncbi:MAG: hypothetical protein WD490_07890 [Opitutales bacterium]
MSTRIQYRALCTVNLWHDFALARGTNEFAALDSLLQERILRDYSIHQWLHIAPTEETRLLLDRHRLRFVRRPTGFMIAGSVRESTAAPGQQVLEIPLPQEFALHFTVDIAQPSFLHEANLTTHSPGSSIFLFSNRSGNIAGNTLHLTAPVPAFDPAKAYHAGDLAVDQGVLMEATEDVPPSASPATAKWMDLPAPRYHPDREYEKDELAFHDEVVFKAIAEGKLAPPPDPEEWVGFYTAAARSGVSKADSIPCLGRETRFMLDPPTPVVKVTVRDWEGMIVLFETFFRQDGNPLEEIRIALPSADPGRYTLEAVDSGDVALPGIPDSFYLHPQGGRPFAAIELASPAGEFNLVDESGHLSNRNYHIRFRHRRAFWRYIFHGDLSNLPSNGTAGDLVQESPGAYATTRPWPINAGVTILKKFGEDRFLPNPSPNSIHKENKKLYAETYLVS